MCPAESDPPNNYYREPYPILSFLIGLYCDPEWSRREFDKWVRSYRTLVPKGSEPAGHVYLYDGYLTPYADMPLAAARIISLDVPESEDADEEGRLKPSSQNFEDLWPYLVEELSQPPKALDPARAFPPRPDIVPLLSALGELFLLDRPVVEGSQFERELNALVAKHSCRNGYDAVCRTKSTVRPWRESLWIGLRIKYSICGTVRSTMEPPSNSNSGVPVHATHRNVARLTSCDN